MHAGSHHLLVYQYFGAHPDWEWPEGHYECSAGNCTRFGTCTDNVCSRGKVGDSCSNDADCDECPPDYGRANLVIGGTQVAGTRYQVVYPEGVGIPVFGNNVVIIANLHYTNPFQPAQDIYGEAWLNFYFHQPGEFKMLLDGVFAIGFRDLFVEPYTTRDMSMMWRPSGIVSNGAHQRRDLQPLRSHAQARHFLHHRLGARRRLLGIRRSLWSRRRLRLPPLGEELHPGSNLHSRTEPRGHANLQHRFVGQCSSGRLRASLLPREQGRRTSLELHTRQRHRGRPHPSAKEVQRKAAAPVAGTTNRAPASSTAGSSTASTPNRASTRRAIRCRWCSTSSPTTTCATCSATSSKPTSWMPGRRGDTTRSSTTSNPTRSGRTSRALRLVRFVALVGLLLPKARWPCGPLMATENGTSSVNERSAGLLPASAIATRR